MKQHGPWKIKSSEVKYKNGWLEVVEDRVIRPDGKDGIFGTVTIRNGSSVLALDDNGFVYLTQEFHYAHGDNSLEVVAGGMDDNEDLLETAKRELREEAGIEAGKWTDLGVINELTTLIRHSQKLYLAQDLTFGSDKQDTVERIEIKKVKFTEAVKMVMESKITDPTSCTLILKVAQYLGKL